MNATRATIDLNCDLGEGAERDEQLMQLVSSANICCGVHAGSHDLMAATVRLAMRHGVAVGAHPGHMDREHFGRRELPISPADCAAVVAAQIAAVARVAGGSLHHVKLHGGLYHQVGRDPALAQAMVELLAARWPRIVVYAESGSNLAMAARAAGLVVAEEAFIDRRYLADGTLVPRSSSGAMIDDPVEAAAQAVRLAVDGVVGTCDGGEIRVAADTLCIHGDGSRAVEIATAAREALAAVGIAIQPASCGSRVRSS